jgi:hypothetical protein
MTALAPATVWQKYVPWPEHAHAAPLNPSLAELQHLAANPVPCLRLAYALSALPITQSLTVLALLNKAAQLALVADFTLAERNLAWPAVFAMGLVQRWKRPGGPNYRAYMRRGALAALVHASGMQVLGWRPLLGGAAALAELAAGR